MSEYLSWAKISSATIKIREWKSGYSLLPPRTPQLTPDSVNDKQIRHYHWSGEKFGIRLVFLIFDNESFAGVKRNVRV